MNLMNKNPCVTRSRIKYSHWSLLALLICLYAFLKYTYIYSQSLWPDEALYAWYGQKIFQNPGFIFSKQMAYPPLFPICLAIGHFFFPSQAACLFVSLAFSLLGILAIYHLGSKIGGMFCGLFSAIALASHSLYFLYGTCILLDVPFIFLSILFMTQLLNVDSKDNLRQDVLVGGIGVCMVLLKWSSVLVLPVLLIYYLFSLQDLNLKHRLKRCSIPFGMIAAAMLLLGMKNLLSIGQLIPNTTAIKGTYNTGPFLTYIKNFNMLLPLPLLIFFVLGLYKISREKTSVKILLFSWLIVFFIMISAIAEKEYRYILSVVPCIIIITSLGIDFLIRKIFKNPLRIFLAGILVLIMCSPIFLDTLMRGQFLAKRKHVGYTGYREAGEWIKKNSQEKTLVLSTSPRAIRYYSGIDYVEDGGNIVPLVTLKTKSDFERFIRDEDRPVLLEIDIWDFDQPRWIYPLSEQKNKYLYSHGFRIVQKIRKMTSFSKDDKAIRTVIWLLIREPNKPI